jgi:hypothetical protein
MPLMIVAEKKEPSFGAAKKKMSFGATKDEDGETGPEGEMNLKDESLSALAEILGIPEKKKSLGRALSAYMSACENDEAENEAEEV